ncbi:MAG: hypothetical protein CR988_02250 [Treponema sp.]|nr:MAG: hypothetical protein CR988_02250 [Treponema sp.]
MDKYMFYYVGGAFLLYISYVMVFKIIPKIIRFFKASGRVVKNAKKLSKGLFSRVYLNDNSTLTNLEYKKIALGALYSEQQTAYINSLETGLKESEIRNLLSEWWRIYSSEEAYKSLEKIANEGQRSYFDIVFKAYKITDVNERTNFIKTSFDINDERYQEHVQNVYSQLDNLRGTFSELKENEIIRNDIDLKRYNNIAWDCGRLVFLSRLCFDIKYISESEAWKYIDYAYELAIENFYSWKDFSRSYIIGRSMWGGKGCANIGIMEIAKELLEHEKSPWVNLKLK